MTCVSHLGPEPRAALAGVLDLVRFVVEARGSCSCELLAGVLERLAALAGVLDLVRFVVEARGSCSCELLAGVLERLVAPTFSGVLSDSICTSPPRGSPAALPTGTPP